MQLQKLIRHLVDEMMQGDLVCRIEKDRKSPVSPWLGNVSKLSQHQNKFALYLHKRSHVHILIKQIYKLKQNN